MQAIIHTLLSSGPFIPHGHCYLWKPGLVTLHIASDTSIALAYYSIPTALIYFVRKRRDLPFNWIFLLFGAFIVACGTTHVIEVWTLWHPTYWLSGIVKTITAVISLYTALLLVPLIPKALALPSPTMLEKANLELEREIAERTRVEEALKQARDDLEIRVQERTAQLQQSLNLEALLKRITDRVRDSLDEDYILQTVVRELVVELGVDYCEVGLYNTDRTTCTIAYEYTMPGARGRMFSVANIHDLTANGQRLQASPNPLSFTRNVVQVEQKLYTVFTCPLLDKQDVLGNLRLLKPEEQAFNELEVRLVQQVANQCAIAVRQARLYQSSQRQVRELERLNHLKDDFLSTVSHELRTPMANIKVATQMLEVILEPMGVLDATSSAAGRYFLILQNECQREINLINDLLDLTHLQSETEPLLPTAIDLPNWLVHITEPFQVRAQKQQQELTLDIPTCLPTLVTDSVYLERILNELLNNACKYTPTGEVIRVTAHATEETIAICISNKGVEIPEAERDRIFDKFYRIPNHDPWKYSGTGLGLALVKRRTEQLQGTIEVTSKSSWTMFTLQLPWKLIQSS